MNNFYDFLSEGEKIDLIIFGLRKKIKKLPFNHPARVHNALKLSYLEQLNLSILKK